MEHRRAAVELEKSVRRLREKFYGQVSVEQAVLLMRRYLNDHAMVCKVIVLCREQLEDMDPEECRALQQDPVMKSVVEKLKQEEEQQKQKSSLDCKNDQDIKAIAQKLRVLPLTERNLRMLDHASHNLLPWAERQFACQPCDSAWWRRVPQRKQVSRCRLCRRHYDPVPYDKMWGTAEFHCPSCNRSFRAPCAWHPLRAPPQPRQEPAAQGAVCQPGAPQHRLHCGHLPEPGQPGPVQPGRAAPGRPGGERGLRGLAPPALGPCLHFLLRCALGRALQLCPPLRVFLVRLRGRRTPGTPRPRREAWGQGWSRDAGLNSGSSCWLGSRGRGRLPQDQATAGWEDVPSAAPPEMLPQPQGARPAAPGPSHGGLGGRALCSPA